MEKDEIKENPDSFATTSDEVEEYFTLGEFRSAQVFVILLTIGAFIFCIGCIWAIKDIFTQTGFSEFMNAPLYIQVLIVGIICVILFFLSIFMAVFYQRIRDQLLHTIYHQKRKNEMTKKYIPAQIVTIGLLVSLVLNILSLAIFGIQSVTIGKSNNQPGFWSLIHGFSGGVQILFWDGIFILAVVFCLAFVFVWYNGYNFIVSLILKYHEKVAVPTEYSKKQKMIGQLFFCLVIASLFVISIGIVWSIINISDPNGWFTFLNDVFGIQLLYISLFATGIFTMLIITLYFYKTGNNLILKGLYFRMPTPATRTSNTSSKIIATGIIIGFFLILIGVVIWIISEWFILIGVKATNSNLFDTFLGLSNGFRVLTFGILTFFILALILCFIFIIHNEYALLIQRIMVTQEKLGKRKDYKVRIKIINQKGSEV